MLDVACIEGVSGVCFTKGQCGDDQSQCTQNKGQWPEAGEGCAGYSLADATSEVFVGPDQQYVLRRRLYIYDIIWIFICEFYIQM
eukprot:COSAG03_NODE_5362_length_1267_cov_477.907534_2_plen_85_part_00